MTKWMIFEREHALEEMFFRKKEAELLARLRKEDEGKKVKEKLAEMSGIHNTEILTHLIEIGIRPETFAAITLIPLIEVAWSAHDITKEEREAILSAASDFGVKAGTPPYRLLESWL